ncbi:MAG: GC-type dockerin domain-anchored protein [Phycisphaerales bacterium]
MGSGGYANCDFNTTAPVLNVADFICFQNHYAAGDAYANCDNSTTPPVLNVADFICFLNAFAAGCP